MQSNVSDTLTDIPFSPSYMRVVKIISVFVTRWVLRKDATLDHCFQTVSFHPHKHFPDLPNTLACFLLTLLLKMCLPLNHIKNISICHERLTCMWIFLGVNSFLSSSPFCFINYCHSKRSPGVVKLLNFWFFWVASIFPFQFKSFCQRPKVWMKKIAFSPEPTNFLPSCRKADGAELARMLGLPWYISDSLHCGVRLLAEPEQGNFSSWAEAAIHLPDLASHDLVLSLFASQFQPGRSFTLVGGLFSFVSSISSAIETFY